MPDSDFQTGAAIYDEAIRIKQYQNKEFFCNYYKVENLKDFRKVIRSLIKESTSGYVITLHIEAHACEDGVQLKSGEFIKWKLFFDIVRPLNIQQRGLLLINTAMCYSLSSIVDIDPEDRAPFFAMVVSKRKVSSEEIIDGYVTFYNNFNNICDFAKAYSFMAAQTTNRDNTTTPFSILTAQQWFDSITDVNRDPSFLKAIASDYIRKEELSSINSVYEVIIGAINKLKRRKSFFLLEDLR